MSGYTIYRCSHMEMLDLLKNDDSFENIECGVVGFDEFGLGVKTQTIGVPLASGQQVNDVLIRLNASAGDEVIVFFSKEGDVILPTDMGYATEHLIKKVSQFQEKKRPAIKAGGRFDSDSVWF